MPPAGIWFNALITSASIVMMASGLVLVLSILGIMNWAHGQLYMLGAFVAYYLTVSLGINYFLALLVAVVVAAAVGIVIERWLLRPLTYKGIAGVTVVALGLIFVFEGIVTLIFGTEPRTIPAILTGIVHIGQVSVSVERLALAGLAYSTMLGLYFFINRTKLGLAIRAAAQEPTVAGLYGVKIGRLFTVVIAIGCGLAAIAGGTIAPVFNLDPFMGGRPFMLALLAIILGGLGSLVGAVVGGFILGLIISIVGYYIGTWYELVCFFAVIAIILFRPQGLFGHAEARV